MHSSGCYSSTYLTLDPKLVNDSFIGKQVILKKLTNASLNGQIGTVVSYDAEKQRYIINIVKPQPKSIAIKKENFDLLNTAQSNRSSQVCISTCLDQRKLAETLQDKLNASKDKTCNKKAAVDTLISNIDIENDPYILLLPNDFDTLIYVYSNAWQIKKYDRDLILFLKCIKIEIYPEPLIACRFQTNDIIDFFSECGLENVTQSENSSTISFPETPYNRQIVGYLSTIMPAFSQLSFDDRTANLTCNLNLMKQVASFRKEIKQLVQGKFFEDMICKFFPDRSTNYLRHIELEDGDSDLVTIKAFQSDGRNQLKKMFNENPFCVGISFDCGDIRCSQEFIKMGSIIAQIHTGSISQTDDEKQTVLSMLKDKMSQVSEQPAGLQISRASVYAVHDWVVVKMPEASLTKNQSKEINNKFNLKHINCDESGYIFVEKKQIEKFQKDQIAIKEKFKKQLEEQQTLGIQSQAKSLKDLKSIIVKGNRLLVGIYPLSKIYLKQVMPPSEYKQFKEMADKFNFQTFKEVGFLLESLKEFKVDILKLNDLEAKRRIESYETFLTDMLEDFCPTKPSEKSETLCSSEELKTLLSESGLKGSQINEVHLLGGASSSASNNRTLKLPDTPENTTMIKELSRQCSSCYSLEAVGGNYSFEQEALAKLQSQLQKITKEDRLQLVSDAQNKIKLSRFKNICKNLGVQINKSDITLTKGYGSTIQFRGLSPDSFLKFKSILGKELLVTSYSGNNVVEIYENMLNFIEFVTNTHLQPLALDQRNLQTLNLILQLVYQNVADHLKHWPSFQNLDTNTLISVYPFDQSIVITVHKITAVGFLKQAFADSYLKGNQCINYQDKTYIIISKQELERIQNVIDTLDSVDVQSLHDQLKPPKEEFRLDMDKCRQILNKDWTQISYSEKLYLFGSSGHIIKPGVRLHFRKLSLAFHPDKDTTADSNELKTKRFQNLTNIMEKFNTS